MTAPVLAPGGATRAQVEAFVVQQRPRPVCTKCIASALGLRSSAVHRAAMMLEGAPHVIRKTFACGLCGQSRLAVRLR